MSDNQTPKVRECTICGEERLTVIDEDGDSVCKGDLSEIPEERRPEGYDA